MFQTEEELVTRLVKHYNKYYTIQEVGVGYGISDLLIIRNQADLIRFIETRQGVYLKDLDDIRVFDYIRKRKKVSLDELISKLFISKSKLKYSILKRLEFSGAITHNAKFYSRNENFKLFCPNVIAIEAKLEDWQTGLAQAIRYHRFAEKSYLAIDDQYIHRVDKKELNNFNVGLISVGSKVKEIIKPILHKPLDPAMRYKVTEEIISRNSTKVDKPHLI
ncbi:hypothetical protein NST04_16900 [Paenibacillus sp. FSL H7-0756]|uniref:hypothetical protein n=1 Tax=Paenibacillus sp. FSL H7-0756 TaxID=2954738 RepID=UPI0030F53565